MQELSPAVLINSCRDCPEQHRVSYCQCRSAALKLRKLGSSMSLTATPSACPLLLTLFLSQHAPGCSPALTLDIAADQKSLPSGFKQVSFPQPPTRLQPTWHL